MACLTCPEEANLGDVALTLQKTALDAEACIYEQEILLQQAINKPTFVWQTTATYDSDANEDDFITSQGSPVILFNNTSSSGPDQLFRQGGLFLFGCTLNVVATGVINDNSIRRLTLVTVDDDFIVNEFVTATVFEANQPAGMDIAVWGLFSVPPGIYSGQVRLFHQNTSSNLRTSIGQIVWVTRLGDNSAVKVV